MKLWYAFFFQREGIDVSHDEDFGFVIRAANPVQCGEIADANTADLPEDAESFATGAVEIGEDPQSEEPGIVLGPFRGSSILRIDRHHVYWRRDEADDVWINSTRLKERLQNESFGPGDFSGCVYDEPYE